MELDTDLMVTMMHRDAARKERDALRAQRDELLAALEHYMSGHPCNNRCPSVVESRAAIARCKA